MKVEDLIKELENHKGKEVFVSLGMTYREIKGIEEEEEINMLYLKCSK